MRKRFSTIAMATAFLLLGVFGAYSYAHDYYLYRGFPPPTDPAGVEPGRLVSQSFWSPALHATRSYKVYLPPGYSAGAGRGTRLPVLYLLHGSPGWPDTFVNAGGLGVTLDTLIARHAIKPFIVVMPDGRNGTYRSDTEWANTSHGRYESFVLDVVRSVDRHFATRADRAHRAIAGNSEGAYAAVNIALHNLPVFGTAESWSGYFRQTPTGPYKGAPPAQLRANSPAAYVGSLSASLHKQPLGILLYGGRSDRDTTQLSPFAAKARAAGATVTAKVVPGRHDWRLWRTQMPAALRFTAAHIGGP